MCIVFWYQSDGTDQKLLMSTPTEAEREQQDIDTLSSPDNYLRSETQKVASDDRSGSMLEEDIVSLEALKRYKLIVAANRDEFLDREAEPLHFWNDTDSDIVAGTDTIRGGTWLGLSRKHKCLSIILNKYAEKKPGERRRNSRGKLCVTSLTNQPDFIENLRSECAEKTYAPFYLLKFDFDEDLKCDYYTCDADGELKHEEIMGTGFSGHSNSSLERPWVKTVKGVQTFKQEVLNSLERTRNECQVEAIQHLKVQLLKVLQGEKRYDDPAMEHDIQGILPQETSEDLQLFSSIFAKSKCEKYNYGTRVHTILIVDHNNEVHIIEHNSVTKDEKYFQFNCE
ncbi:transport and Golgi organization 2 homolog isoform X2 [Convolutriloba macropyga]|uniref:transport and Golgi organization 2 homolog isoform X2 n=1 Tax=Convolutriloba macropyga TaxID=536237 RepID=UPI003F51CD54